MFQPVENIDALEQQLLESERLIGEVRRRQADVIRRLDQAQVTLTDGARTLTEWVAGRLDIDDTTAAKIVRIARSDHAFDDATFDRESAMVALADAGASERTLAHAFGSDLNGVRRMSARHRRMSATVEREAFAGRYLTIQPSLDESTWRLSGQLVGVDGRVVDKVLTELADEVPSLPDGTRESRSARTADALVMICQDSRSSSDPCSASEGPIASVFVDASLAAASNGEAGVWIAEGPRIGPAALREILCSGTIEVTALTETGEPLAVGTASKSIPPRLRRHVVHRDGGACTVDGCRSRYRLQVHHVRPRSAGGDNHPDNLATVCWFHHHVAIHGRGYELDPASPPQRRRFLRARRGPPGHH